MPPFSNKKKKLQLQQKRQLKRERADDPNAFYRTIMQKTHFRGKPIGQQNGRSDNKALDTGQKNREKFADLQFFKDSDEEIKLRKEQSTLPIRPLEKNQLEIDAIPMAISEESQFEVNKCANSPSFEVGSSDDLSNDQEQPDDNSSNHSTKTEVIKHKQEQNDTPTINLEMPKRPPWNKSLTKEQLDRQEQIYFKNFVDNLLEKAALTGKKLSYFDLNLDTWRQLWRVLELSEVITIIVDIRHPLFHFPPSLYKYIVEDLRKSVIIVLNKIDLVSGSIVLAWQNYLKNQYPEVHIVPFASYAGMKTRTNGKRVGLMKMAADGARRFMLEVEKVVGPGKVDFTSWKEKIQADCKDTGQDNDDESQPEDDDDEDEEKSYKAEALRNAQQIKEKNDTTFYSGERFKDGILTIGCVGHPNVGKSSFMNALIGKKVVSVSRTPGHTKHFQTIFLTPNVRLCDCPGLVFPSYYPKELQVLMGCYPISQLREPYSSIRYLAERVDIVDKLKLKPADEVRHEKPAMNDRNYTTSKTKSNIAGTSGEWSPFTICESWAMHRGFLTARSGRPDVYRSANHLLRMALDGRTLCMAFYPPDFLSQKEFYWDQHEDLEKIHKIQGRQNIINEEDDGY